MSNLLLFRDVSLCLSDMSENIFDFDNILSQCQHLKESMESIEFNGTLDLVTKISSILGSGIHESINCIYTEKYVIQAFFTDNADEHKEKFDKIIFIKRIIHDDDSYTFFDFDFSRVSTYENIEDAKKNIPDKFIYTNIEFVDIVEMIKKKHILDGIVVRSDGQIQQISYINNSVENDVGSLLVNMNNDIRKISYIDSASIIGKLDENNIDAEYTRIVNEKMNDNIEYFYAQNDGDICLFNCYYPTFGLEKNELVSKLICSDVYGDVILGLENKFNDDNRSLNITPELFTKLYNIKTSNNPFKSKNNNFFNLYKELL